MRTTFILLLSILVLSSALAAQSDLNSGLARSASKSVPQRSTASARSSLTRRSSELALLYDDNVCYTMHTLVVARERGSDQTRLVRQQTCTPSDRFRVNHSAKPPRVIR